MTATGWWRLAGVHDDRLQLVTEFTFFPVVALIYFAREGVYRISVLESPDILADFIRTQFDPPIDVDVAKFLVLEQLESNGIYITLVEGGPL